MENMVSKQIATFINTENVKIMFKKRKGRESKNVKKSYRWLFSYIPQYTVNNNVTESLNTPPYGMFHFKL